MKKYILISVVSLVAFFGFFQIVFAQSDPTWWGGTKTPIKIPYSNTGVANTNSQTNTGVANTNSQTNTGVANTNSTTNNDSQVIEKIPDPIPGEITVEELLLKLFDIVLYIAIPLVAFFMIYSGFMFVSAQGNAEAIETAKKRLGWTIFGAVILLGAWTISQAIKGTIDDIKNGGKTSYLEKYTLS